jgi:hypothetical protein
MAGKSKITPAAKRRSNERECLLGNGFVGVPTFSTIVITSIKPVPTREEFNCESSLGAAPGRASEIPQRMPTFRSLSALDERFRHIARLGKASALVWRRSVC